NRRTGLERVVHVRHACATAAIRVPGDVRRMVDLLYADGGSGIVRRLVQRMVSLHAGTHRRGCGVGSLGHPHGQATAVDGVACMTAQPSDPATGSGVGTVTPERFARVRAIFEAAREQPGRDRQAFVKGACLGDAVLLREVEAMLAADATGAPVVGPPAAPPSSRPP